MAVSLLAAGRVTAACFFEAGSGERGQGHRDRIPLSRAPGPRATCRALAARMGLRKRQVLSTPRKGKV